MRVRKAALMAVTVGVVGFCGRTVFGDGGLLTIRRMHLREIELKARADGLEAKNAELRERVRKLQDDDQFLERVAREQQGFVKDGETVYRFSGD